MPPSPLQTLLARRAPRRSPPRPKPVPPRGTWLIGWVLLIGLLVGTAHVAQSQVGTAPATPEIAYTFGEQITFRVQFPPNLTPTAVEVFFQANSDPTVVEPATFADDSWAYQHDVRARYVRAFATVTYWFRLTLADGTTQETEHFSFFYEDNRFKWESMEGVPFRVHWYTGDTAFATAVLDAARIGAQRTGLVLDTEFTEAVDIYVYDNLDDYKFVREAMAPQWAGGHADPEAGLIVVSLPPGADQASEIERKVPHEVAHLLLYQATGTGFYNLPTWLNEGFASTQESNPRSDYPDLVANAIQKGTMIPLTTLCQPFPRDAAGAVLSYAEATMFVQYVKDRFGIEGLRAIVQTYANGAGCELGTNVAPINLTLPQLELEWREGALAENVFLTALREIAPWLVLMGAVIVGPILVVMVGLRRPRPVTNP